MQAYVLHGINDIRLEEVVKPQPQNNEVIVKVKAAGICGSDIPRIYQTGAHIHPLIPGHEFSGQVIQAGTNASDDWVGKRVGVFPLIPCHECSPCQKKNYELCRNYSYLGSRRDGGFAEYVAVPVSNLLELPESVSFEQAAMLEPMSVAVHAMRRANPISTERVAIYGVGTIGMFLLMFLIEAGVKEIFVIGNKEFQKANVLRLGIPEDHYCDTGADVDSWLNEMTLQNGIDVFFECIGKNETVSFAIAHAAPNGRVILVGNPYSDVVLEKQVYWKILRNQLTVTGTWNSSFTGEDTDDWHYVLHKLQDKRITPEQFISHRFLLEQLEQGFHIMRDKSEEYIKIMALEE